MMKTTLKLLIVMLAMGALSCGEAVILTPSANIEYVIEENGAMQPLNAEQVYDISFMEYPNEGTMFKIKGAEGNSIELFIGVLPANLEARTYKLAIDEANKSNLSYTLKVDGKTRFCCNANSSGLLTISSTDILSNPEGIKGSIVAAFELEDGLLAKVKGSFTAVKE